MSIELRDSERIIFINDGTTLQQVLQAIRRDKLDKERKKQVGNKYYIPNGKPRGRPKKIKFESSEIPPAN